MSVWRPPGNSTTFTIRDFRRRAEPSLDTVVAECAYGNRRTCTIKCPPTAPGGRLDLLVDPSSNLSTKYTFLYPGRHLIPRTSLHASPLLRFVRLPQARHSHMHAEIC
jgi:hypothetical protein